MESLAMQVDKEAVRPGDEPASNGSPVYDSITVVEPSSSSAVPEAIARAASPREIQTPPVSNLSAASTGSNGQSSMQSSSYRSPALEIRQNPSGSHMPAHPMFAARPSTEVEYHPGPDPPSTTYAAVAASMPTSTSLPPHVITRPTTAVADMSRLTAAEKGKGRAAQYPSTMASTTILAQTPPAPYTPTTPSAAAALAATESLQGKRVPKKRRLSANGEIDPESLQSDGTLKKSRKKPSGANAPPYQYSYNGHASSSSHPPPSTNGMYHPVTGTDATSAPMQPMSAVDTAYVQRLQRNAEKPYLTEMSGQCSLWAVTRRALQGAAEYLRNPVTTDGASVEIGEGGIARGVILEGQEQPPRGYWGERKMAGTMICAIGPARPRRLKRTSAGLDPKVEDGVSQGSDQEPTGAGQAASSQSASSSGPEPEVPVVEALLAAHRLRRPVGVAVAQDYSTPPFKVPRPFIVLGWFWITAAWVEPEPTNLLPGCLPENEKVRFRFRFDWCNEGDTLSASELPWWVRMSDLKREILPAVTASPSAEGSGGNDEVSITGVVGQQVPSPDPSSTASSCDSCHSDSSRLFVEMPVCLTEYCDAYFRQPVDPSKASVGAVSDWVVRVRLTPVTMRADASRLTPRALGLDLRPPEPQSVLSTGPSLAAPGADFWRAWACKVCKMANERRRWSGWDCESCKCSHQPQRPRYNARELRQTRRPECFGPRQDDGSPLFPDGANIVRSWSLYEDESKVVKYHVESLFGEGSELMLAMHTEGSTRQVHMQHALWIQNELLDRLQQQGRAELNLRRHVIQLDPIRPAEKYLSPFYTLLYGPELAPDIECFPTGAPMPWRHAPQLAIDVVDYMNDRAGRMFPGESERFNSLLIVAFPPLLRHHPRFVLEPFTYTSLLVLGPDAEIRLRATSRPAPKTSGPSAKKQPLSKLLMQHGDVLGIRAGDDPLEVTVSLESFGFVCIGRQVYLPIVDKRDIETQMRTDEEDERPLRASIASSGFPGDSADADTLDNRPPPRPTKAAVAPLANWYVGPRPLDPAQPIRTLPPLRDRQSPVGPAADSAHQEETASVAPGWPATARVVVLESEPEEPTLHSPAPTQLPVGSRRKQAEELQDLGIKKVARPRKPRQKRVSEVAGSERGSAGTPDAFAMDVDPETASQTDGAGDPAGDEVGSVIEVKEESERSTPVSIITKSKRGGGRQSLGRGGKRAGSTAGSASGAKRGRGKAKANS